VSAARPGVVISDTSPGYRRAHPGYAYCCAACSRSTLSLLTHTRKVCGSPSATAFSIYGAMIVASALQAGCNTLWSEDMQHGMRLDEGLAIETYLNRQVVTYPHTVSHAAPATDDKVGELAVSAQSDTV